MAAYKMEAVKVTPPNDFPLGLIRSHMVVIHLFLMLWDLQGMVMDLRSTLYTSIKLEEQDMETRLRCQKSKAEETNRVLDEKILLI
jgi:hypothetical protein